MLDAIQANECFCHLLSGILDRCLISASYLANAFLMTLLVDTDNSTNYCCISSSSQGSPVHIEVTTPKAHNIDPSSLKGSSQIQRHLPGNIDFQAIDNPPDHILLLISTLMVTIAIEEHKRSLTARQD